MIEWLNVFCVLAADNPSGSPLGALLFPMIAIFVLWYFLILRPQSRDRRKREEMLKVLKKNDRIITVGGIVGTVANISADGKEVTVKVDDNTRIKFLRSSIQTVGSEDSEKKTLKAS